MIGIQYWMVSKKREDILLISEVSPTRWIICAGETPEDSILPYWRILESKNSTFWMLKACTFRSSSSVIEKRGHWAGVLRLLRAVCVYSHLKFFLTQWHQYRCGTWILNPPGTYFAHREHRGSSLVHFLFPTLQGVHARFARFTLGYGVLRRPMFRNCV